MNPNPKPANAPGTAESDVARTCGEALTSFASFLHRSVERLAGLQKTTLDVLGHQAADMMETVRRSYNIKPDLPIATVLDLTDKALESWIGTQKTVVDLMVDQSAHVVDVTKVRHDSFSKSIDALSEFAQKTAETTVAAEKSALDFAAKQNKVVADAIRKHNGSIGKPATEFAESMERGINSVIDTQKEVLEAASKLPTTVTSKA